MNRDRGKHANGANPSSLMVGGAQPLGHYGEQQPEGWEGKWYTIDDLSNKISNKWPYKYFFF